MFWNNFLRSPEGRHDSIPSTKELTWLKMFLVIVRKGGKDLIVNLSYLSAIDTEGPKVCIIYTTFAVAVTKDLQKLLFIYGTEIGKSMGKSPYLWNFRIQLYLNRSTSRVPYGSKELVSITLCHKVHAWGRKWPSSDNLSKSFILIYIHAKSNLMDLKCFSHPCNVYSTPDLKYMILPTEIWHYIWRISIAAWFINKTYFYQQITEQLTKWVVVNFNKMHPAYWQKKYAYFHFDSTISARFIPRAFQRVDRKMW